MFSYRFIEIVAPVKHLLPEVEAPLKRQAFREKLLWTAITLFIYLACSQISLYGVKKLDSADPLFWLRTILASNKGTLMELGLAPVVAASMFLHLLTGLKVIDCNMGNKNDRELFQAAQKLLGILITLTHALAYLFAGMYGRVEDLGIVHSTLIVAQLLMAGIIVLLLDELLQKGYGLGSGSGLFIATNICGAILWKTFSFMSVKTLDGSSEFEGCIIAFFHNLLFRPNKLDGLHSAFFRQYAPNLSNLIATILVGLLVNFFQNFRVELQMQSRRVRGHSAAFPIKLFYTAGVSIMLQLGVVSTVYFWSFVAQSQMKGSFFANLLGQWQDGQTPIGGLAYYITPPHCVSDLFTAPQHFIVYTAFVLISCSLFSKMWIEVSGSAPRDVCRQLTEQEMTIEGGLREDTMKRYLSRYINTAATFGGFCLGALCLVADCTGAIGTGTGIVLAVTIIFQIFEQIAKEKERGQDTMFF